MLLIIFLIYSIVLAEDNGIVAPESKFLAYSEINCPSREV
jgi:hypothetical protein